MSDDTERSPSLAHHAKKKRPKGLAESGFGFGRPIELDVRDALRRILRQALTALVLGPALVFAGWVIGFDERAGVLVTLSGAVLLPLGAWSFASYARHRDRDDLVARFDHQRVDVPRLALTGPSRMSCGYEDIAKCELVSSRLDGLSMVLATKAGAKAAIPQDWVTPNELWDLAWRITLRTRLSHAHAGKTPRAVLVGAEALFLLQRQNQPVAGVVLSRTATKQPVVVGTVASMNEFFERLEQWPEDAKLYVEENSSFTDPRLLRG